MYCHIRRLAEMKKDVNINRFEIAKTILLMVLIPLFFLSISGFSTEYYVKNGGNDSNSGLSDAQAWATLGKVASTLVGNQSDNRVNLKCGSVWRETLNLAGWGTSGHRFVIGKYGTGDDPKIMGSEKITGWSVYSGNIWRAISSAYPGGGDNNGPVWFVNRNGDGKTHWGNKETSLGNVNAEYDWYWSGSYLYVYSPASPDSRYDAVEAARRFNCIASDWNTHYITIENIHACFTARQTINDDYGADYWIIDGCYIHHSGPHNASTTWAADNIKWEGTGWWIKNNVCHDGPAHNIQHYATSNASGDIIEHNTCYDAYHVSIDVKQAGPGIVLSNQTIRYNLIFCTNDYAFPSTTNAAISCQSDYANCLDGVDIYYNLIYNIWTYGIYCTYYAKNVEIYNNVVYSRHPSSPFDCWGIAVYSDVTGNKPTNVKVKNNIVAGDFGSGGHGFHLSWIGSIAGTSDVDYNCYYVNSGQAETYREDTGIAYHSNDWAAWKTATGFDTHSPWNSNPLFTNPGSYNFSIQASSPCRDAGANVGLTQDYFGLSVPQGNNPDIGVHEYSGAPPPLSVTINASPTSGQAPLAVNFTGSATGGTTPYSYSWTFGDGGSSTSQNPAHTYSSVGTYTATLTVTDSVSATASKSLTITATATSPPLTANASASPTSGQAPLTVSFTASASGGTSPYSYSWTFGDGGSSTSQNPSHTYSSAGTYTATLTVTDSQSATNSKSLTITATSSPSQLLATASANPTSGQAPLAVNFTGSATGGTAPYSYSWTFGDGGSSTTRNPSHTYSSDGNYTATLTVTDLSFANASAMVNITVGETSTTANLSLAAQTGAPAPGEGGTTNPSPGNHSYSIGSTVSVKSVVYTDYRFSKWAGDIALASMFNSPAALTLNKDKSLSATFCTKCADVNGDLKITPGDAQLAFDIYLGRISNPTWCQLENADVNCSGTKLSPKVTPADAQMIFYRYIRRGTFSSTCSGNSRAAAVSTLTAGFKNADLTIDNMAFTPGLDILIPIIIECPSEVTAFGFDFAFPSNVLTFVRLESTELTKGYAQLDANVIPYQPIDQEQAHAEPAETLVLRVGGYKTNPDQSPSSGVLVTLIFRGTGEFIDPNATSMIIATYDDLQNASVINRMISRQDNSQIRENKRQGKNVKRMLPGKRSDY